MSRLLVISDSHGDRQIVEEICTRYVNEVDFLFHNGDSELLPEDSLWKDFCVVGGNVDFPGFPKENVLNVGKKDVVFQTHGHLYGVKLGQMERLLFAAQENEATIVLFGHTHQIYCERHRGILFLNPGSISFPRGEIREKSYALLEVQEKVLDVQYYNRAHEKLENLRFQFSREEEE